jgi:hypothetical protein
MFRLIHPALAQADGLHAVMRAHPVPEPSEPATRSEPAVEIRLAWASDGPALVRLAQLDSALVAAAELPGLAATGDVLVAFADHHLVAALSLADGLLASDPFRRTDRVIALLHLRRRQLAQAERRHGLARLGMLRARHS